MKIGYTLMLAVVTGLFVLSCSKDSSTPSVNIGNAINLAGASGSSKNWTMTAASGTVDNGASQTITLKACALDNIYTFSNNSSQDFIQTEGPTNTAIKCNSVDSVVAESGNWAFSNDGKSLVVEGYWFDDLSEATLPFFLTANGESFKIVQLTATTLVLSYAYTNSGHNYVITLTFTKAL